MLTSVWLTLTPSTTPAGPTGTGVHSASEPLVVGYPTPRALIVPAAAQEIGKDRTRKAEPEGHQDKDDDRDDIEAREIKKPPKPCPDKRQAAVGFRSGRL